MRNLTAYLVYILLSLAVTLMAAVIQSHLLFGHFDTTLLPIPTLVGLFFGLLLGYVHQLRLIQRRHIQDLKEKDREISALNASLQAKSEAKTHELSEQRLYTESILNAQNSIIVITDGYRILKANRRFFDYIDDFTSIEEFQEKYDCICDLFAKKAGYIQPDINDARWTTYILERPGESHRVMIRYKEREFIFAVTAKKFIYGSSQRVIATFEEITTLVRYEQELEASIERELEKNRQKDAIIFQQSRFTAVGEALRLVSHHWRQPLSALSLMIQDIEEAKHFGELNDDYLRSFSERSLQIIQEMSRTLDSFRDIFTTDPNPGGKFELHKAIQTAEDVIRPNIKSDRVTIRTDIRQDHIAVSGPRNEYIHVVVGILTNAMEALESVQGERTITITLDLTPEGKSRTVIANNGSHIPEAMMEKIYDPYYSTKFDKNGTGLGLFIAKNIIEQKMHGSLSARNTPDGVEFEITI